MSRLRDTLADLTDERFRTAVLLGLASIPFTVALSWESAPTSFSAEAVVAAGLLAGLHYADRSSENADVGLLEGLRYGKRPAVSRRAGVVVGVVGSAPAVGWAIGYMLERAWSLSGWLGAATVALLPAVVPLLVALFALAGGVGAAVGDWLVTRVDRARDRARSRAEPDADGDVSGWWRWVVAYIVFAPAVLLYTFGVGPESGAAFALSVLALLVLVPFSLFVAVALFEDAVTLREVGRDRGPNYWAYVGAPLAAYAVVYLVATVLASPNPSGDGVYGFVVALWISSAVYLRYRRRYVGTA
ncbi:transposase [Natrinema sp. LN54]|uniref:transposase n=1 Tax=Natrinema sp. LN54 TaxID=3458705 RepID=UPI004036F4EA